MGQYSLFPVFVSIVDVPLFTEADHADVARPRDHVSSRFVVDQSMTIINQFLSDQIFGLSYLGSFEVTNNHCSLMEAFLIGFILSLLEQLLVILTLDF